MSDTTRPAPVYPITTFRATGILVADAWRYYSWFDVKAGTTITASITGTGDPDLYVMWGGQPSLNSWTCRPWSDGANETCALVGPGRLFVAIHGFRASNTYELVVTYVDSGAVEIVPPPPPPFSHLNVSGSVTIGEMRAYPIPISAGKKIVIRTVANGNVDLYLQMNTAPTTRSHVASSCTPSGDERLVFTAPSTGTLYVGVHGVEKTSFTAKTGDG